LTHELTNLTNKNVTYQAVENAAANPNSVISVLNTIPDNDLKNQQVISPYLFAPLYTNKDKEVLLDGAKDALKWLDDNPERSLDIVTNSVVTSDNFFAQSVIDMDLAPRLLLSEELQAAWLEKPADSELNAELVESEEWRRMINHPRLRIYETGRIDDIIFGGDVAYGKQHAKYIVSDDVGFVGTTNFDYRSRLYNNEMGFVFESRELAEDIRKNTEYLISLSYRWGTPEWLEMRRRLMELKGSKATAARNQRKVFKTLRNTGLIWYF
jgi:phosphatidylserine/phosphatidylglycerophosphate/cardiolipin synthase-like enzyme